MSEQSEVRAHRIQFGAWLEGMWRDFGYSARVLRKSPGFTAVAVLTLALGIGATTLIFCVVDSVLLHPFPYKDADRLVYIFVNDLDHPAAEGRSQMTVQEFLDYKRENHVFAEMAATRSTWAFYAYDGATYFASAQILEPSLFSELGVKPVLGRTLADSDTRPGAPAVAMISDHLWRERFNRDPKAVGAVMTVTGVRRTVVGVMPPQFRFGGSDIWMPAAFTPDLTMAFIGGPADYPLLIEPVARLKAGISPRQAADNLAEIARSEATIYPKFYPKHFTTSVKTIAVYSTNGLRSMMGILLGAVLLLLLLACSNAANLLLSRATAREKELVIRSTLGASRSRLISQVFCETLLLALAGATLGCVLAYAGLQGVKATIPLTAIPAGVEISISSTVLLATIAVTLLVTICCGFAPAFVAVRRKSLGGLSAVGKGLVANTRHGRLRAGLVTCQVALSILLLAGAGLMMRTLFALQRVDLGFDPRHLLFATLTSRTSWLALRKGKFSSGRLYKASPRYLG
jgi:putative ABC transport system permease protein